jgi:septal ring factor EnvC (AmiA/AmiB activator)
MILDGASPDSTIESLKLVAQGGAAVAAIVVTVLFLRYLREERTAIASERERQMSDRQAERLNFKESLESIVAGHERSMTTVSDSLRDLRDRSVKIEAKIESIERSLTEPSS